MEFAEAVLQENSEAFVIHIDTLKAIPIYFYIAFLV